MTLKVRTFSKKKGKKWLIIPFTVNSKQEKWFDEILSLKLYHIEVIRRVKNGDVLYFAHVSYKIPEKEIEYGFENGAVGLDMNYSISKPGCSL